MTLSFTRGCAVAVSLVFLSMAGGCNAVGYIAAVAKGNQQIAASYKGLPGQKVGIMVWVDDGILNDYREIQLDTARGIELKLQQAAKANIEEAQNITWVPPERILQFQQNHPTIDADAAEEIAPRLGVSRLIYVEVEQFQTHPNESPELWRGSMIATLKVVEVADGKGKVAFTERGVSVIAPRKCPAEGLPNLDDASVYQATLDNFTSAAAERFVPHEADVDDSSPPESVMQQ